MRTLLLTTVLLVVGCGVSSDYYGADATAERSVLPESELATAPTLNESEPGEAIPDSDAIQRKIIYSARVELVVEDFDPVRAAVEDVVKQFDAYVARSNVSGSPGQPRNGSWTIRVPVARYNEFLAAARELGELRSEHSDSKDVTAEFYDVDARVRNKQREEERLIKLLEDATGKLQDILEVERELSRVRGEIEQLQGRLRVLNDLTSMTTVELFIDEIRNYVPESPDGPTYATRVRRAFEGSIAALVVAAQGVSIAFVAAAPWLGLLLVLLLILYFVIRLFRRRR